MSIELDSGQIFYNWKEVSEMIGEAVADAIVRERRGEYPHTRGLVTDDERKTFHEYCDGAIDKLNSKKNRSKPHWLETSVTMDELAHHLDNEVGELFHELFRVTSSTNIKLECYDIINIALMIIDRAIKEGD